MKTNIEKRRVRFREFKAHCKAICYDIEDSEWRPDYIVGITRGGLLPAVMVSHYFGTPLYTLKVSLRESGKDCETNCWMSEDAFSGKNILIVDDINDSGATFNWLVQDWEASCKPSSEQWQSVWNKNVRFATIFNNKASEFTKQIDYYSERLDKSQNNVWIEFPYEQWWDKGF